MSDIDEEDFDGSEFEDDIEDEEEDIILEENEEDEEEEKVEGDIDEIDEDEFENEEDEDDDEDDEKKDELQDEDIDILLEDLNDMKIDTTSFITVPFITKYEYPKILSIRAQQIASNYSQIYIDISDKDINKIDPLEIAEMEFNQGKLNNMIIERILPNGIIEKRKLSELKFYSFY